jgi:serine/threonine protein kinase
MRFHIKITFKILRNILLFQNYDKISIKIADFNLSRVVFSTNNSDRWSLWYQSPEIINNQPHSFKTDVW